MRKMMARLFLILGAIVMLAPARTASAVNATGGNMVNTGTYVIHTFTNAGTTNFTVAVGGNVEVLVVAGGGGGGGDIGGGGGAGGLIYTQSLAVTAGPYTVTVGAGGAGGPASTVGFRGSNSVFGTLIAYGGGGGGGWNASAATSGGSGGGGYSGANGAAGTNTQGNAGGNGGATGTAYPGGGGGGARSNGVFGTATNGGNGGSGTNLPQFATVGGFPAGWFAGGGGGGVYNNAGPEGQGGNGGGGNGGGRAVSNYGSNGVVNTGGGGGGASRISTMLAGGAGGSGIVMVRYASTIANLAVSNVTLTSAAFNGNLITTNGLPSSVLVYWGTSDGGTVASAWGNTNQFPDYQPLGVLTTNVAGLSSNTTYYYTFCLVNSAATNWASPSSAFLPGQVSIVATAPNASEVGPVSGAFTVYRPATATNGNLAVNYTVAGTASNGVDYALLAGTVTIPDGQASATITVQPFWDQFVDGSQTVQATLVAGAYIIGSQSNDTVTIADYAKRVWSGTGNWTNTSCWSGATLPSDGDAVIVTNGTLTLSNSTPHLAYFTLTNSGALTFNGTNTALQADNVIIAGSVTHPIQSALTTNTDGKWYPDNRVWFVCSNFTLVAGKSISVDSMGYQGGTNATDPGKGPGGTLSGGNPGCGGAGYGGRGGDSTTAGGSTYGDFGAPVDPGSGGGYLNTPYTPGGGAVRIQATGCVTINGTISARGGNHTNRSGGGSGGGIYITCSTFQGIGLIAADGGYTQQGGGGGGGGRIAVIYDTAAQTTVSPKPAVQLSAAHGTGPGGNGAPGTIYVPDMNFFPYAVLPYSCRVLVSNTTSYVLSGLTLSNSYVFFGGSSLQSVTVSNDMTILGASGRYDVTTNTALYVGGNLALTNGATLYAFGGVTNGSGLDYGVRVSVTGDVSVATTCWVYPYSETTNGGSPLFQMRNLSVITNAGFDANLKGFRGGTSGSDNGKGPGGSASGGGGPGTGGAGYGGKGGNSGTTGGPAYGDPNAPLFAGSGAGYYNGNPTPAGGGLIRIEASGTVTLNGTLTANGGDHNNRSGGASGGGIYIKCATFSGSNGVMSAIGGSNTSTYAVAGGSGGRIAVLSKYQFWSGTTNVVGGTAGGGGAAGDTGTVRWVQAGAPPLIANLAPTNISYTSANLNGYLTSTGTAPTTVWVYWGLSDQSNNKNAWDTNGTLGVIASPATLTTNVTGLAPGTNYYYRFYASNSVGDVWAAPATGFATPAPLPTIANATFGATNVTLTSACLNGYLVATGLSPTAVAVYWGPSDAGTNSGASWAYTNTFAGYPPVGPLSMPVNLPTPNTYYYYRYNAQNSGGTVWADPVSVFMAGQVGVIATAPNASKTGPVPGTVTVYRASSVTNLAITVNYAIGGTAMLGTDYTLSPAGTNIVMGVGVSNVTIAVNPIWSDVPAGNPNVTLTLLSGPYAQTAQNSATVTIADATIVAGSNGTVAAGDWWGLTNWSKGRPPVAGDTVYIANNTTLSNTTRALAALTVLSGSTLTFYGTNTSVTAVNVTINGTVTHAVESAQTTNADGHWYADNRVWFVCTNLTVATNGTINVNSMGYQGGVNSTDRGKGPGGTASTGNTGAGGAGHGDVGAAFASAGGVAYDNPAQPAEPGSGGGYNPSQLGGNGGGLVRLDVAGAAIVNGPITARGGDGSDRNGAGSGGSILLTCDTIQGAGSIRADAGNAGANGGGGAGGGRVAVLYSPGDQLGVSPKPTVQLSAARGMHSSSGGGSDGYPGSVYVADTNFFPYTVLTSDCRIMAPGVTNWAVSSLTLSNCWLLFADGQSLTVAGNFTIAGSLGRYDMSNTFLTVGGSLMLTNGAQLFVTSGATNSGGVDYGALVTVGGELAIATNCWIYPYSHSENGGSPFFQVGSLRVLTNAGINADNKGFRGGASNTDIPGRGPGGSTGSLNSGSGGGGYGGLGGTSITAGGATYGNSNAPTQPGSGSGYVNGTGVPAGGGLIRIQANGPITLNGTLTANGGNYANRSGGGSGGGIYLRGWRLSGGGQMTARGGTVTPGFAGGGGGGGRIAIYATGHDSWTGITDVSGGTGYNGSTDNGQVGTIVWRVGPLGSVFTVQ